MRRKGSLNKKGRIEYPRKCDICDYVSNNPSMYHYHKVVHQKIPNGTLCENGCGQPATNINTTGKMLCSSRVHYCQVYIDSHSKRISNQWASPKSNKRRETFRKLFTERMSNPTIHKKTSATKRKKFGTLDPERAKDYRHYARYVRERAQKWARDNGYKIGRQTYHVDHILSVNEAWKAGLPEPIVNHPVNLRILDSRLNSSKGAKSLMTVEELYLKIQEYDNVQKIFSN